MNSKPYSWIVIDRLEYYITKEIEKAVYNKEGKSFSSLYKRIMECINARNELGYNPVYIDVKEFLEDYGYDDEYICRFIILAQLDAKEEELMKKVDYNIKNNIELKYLFGEIKDYINERNKICRDSKINDIKALLNKYGYDEKIVNLLK